VLDVALAAALYGDPTVAFSFADPRISEYSGLASGSVPGQVFTHNDSGDSARLFAVGDDGRTRTTYVLPGVQARDWEDIARGPDEAGRSSLWIGDIGDNGAARERGILVHRVLEPPPTDQEEVATEPPTSFRLRYPDSPRDAEGLMVHPRTGQLYVVSKPLAGPAQVYAAPQPLDPAGPNLLEPVAQARVGTSDTSGGPGIGNLAQPLVTAADISPDGSRVAVRTYTDLYEWSVDGDDVAGAFDGEPVVTPLPPTEQGEGLAYTADGTAVLVSSEGAGAPVHRLVRTAPTPVPEPGPTTSGAPAAQARPADAPADARWPLLAGAALLAALLVVRGTVRRRRYRRR